MKDPQDETRLLVERARAGDRQVLGELFGRHRDRLLRMIRLRLDRRLRDRVDCSDVVQEVHVEAVQRLDRYLSDPAMPFFLWLRFLTVQKVQQHHRRHLGAEQRDVRAEVRLSPGPLPGATSAAIAEQVLGRHTAPSAAAARAETRQRVVAALEAMDPVDRQVLALRHFEQLTNAEASAELGLEQSAGSKRYLRALKKLERILGGPA